MKDEAHNCFLYKLLYIIHFRPFDIPGHPTCRDAALIKRALQPVPRNPKPRARGPWTKRRLAKVPNISTWAAGKSYVRFRFRLLGGLGPKCPEWSLALLHFAAF
uniref:Uncharacterized protein n=1 Tax=Anopheles merus TaxID=30066 RepID=A0A182V8V9_ANOME